MRSAEGTETGGSVAARILTPRAPRRYPPRRLPPPGGPRLRAALASEHGRDPFRPTDVRGAAHRVVAIAGSFELEAYVVRGGLDVGGAELDHVWAVVHDAVVDVSMPVVSESFGDLLRAYVAGDLDRDELDRSAHGYALEWRVVGEYPDRLRYVGLPVWSG